MPQNWPLGEDSGGVKVKVGVECVVVNLGEKSQCQWKSIPDRGANHRKWTKLFII